MLLKNIEKYCSIKNKINHYFIMRSSWNKGFIKDTHLSVMKISETMRSKKIDNFYAWRIRMKKEGKIIGRYNNLRKSKDLAELIGVVLGDGHIEKFPRTERLIISSHSKNCGFIDRYRSIVREVFLKDPTCMKVRDKNCVRISIYQKLISQRIGIPTGNRGKSKIGIPDWIWKNKKYLISCLRGLYRAEGFFVTHLQTYTYKAAFCNRNKKLLDDVYRALRLLEFSPLYERYRVMISRKQEFFRLKRILNFRQY